MIMSASGMGGAGGMAAAVPGGVGPSLWIERRFNVRDDGAKTDQHGADHVVGADQNSAWLDRGREMSVSQMPGEACEVMSVPATHIQKALRLGPHFHDASILEPQAIAMAQNGGFDQVKEKDQARPTMHGDAPAVPVVIDQVHVIRRSAGPGACCFYCRGAQHQNRK
jgi:hypothetical protein